MDDEHALLTEASDLRTAAFRLQELSTHPRAAVRLAAMTNTRFDIRELADMIYANDPELVASAIDAIIARPREFQYVPMDAPEVMDLVPARLTETRDGEYVVSDEAFEALMRGWNSATAAVVAFDVTDRQSILDLYLEVDPGKGDEDDEEAE